MKYSTIKKHSFLLINLIIILLTIINLYNLLMKYNYTAILFFFIVSFVVYYFNKNLAIILGIPLFLTNIINSFTNLFNIKLIEGFTSDDVNNLKTKLDDYYITSMTINSIQKNNNEFQKNNTEKQGVDNAFKLLIKIINDKTYSSNTTIMNDANFLFTSLNLLDTAIQTKQFSKIAILNIDIMNSYNKIISEMNKPSNPQPGPVPPQPPPKPKPINPICDNIMDTKLCCDTRPKYEWNELTGICKTK